MPIRRVTAAAFLIALTLLVACTASAPAGTPTPTSTHSVLRTPPPTSTFTPAPTSTEVPTQTPVLTPTIARETVNICVVQPDGKPAKGAYIAISDANYKLLIPNDGTTGIVVTAKDGCRAVKLPPGVYHVAGQKVMSLSKYANGTADFEVKPGSSVEVQIKLTVI